MRIGSVLLGIVGLFLAACTLNPVASGGSITELAQTAPTPTPDAATTPLSPTIEITPTVVITPANGVTAALTASAELEDADGNIIGNAIFTETISGVAIGVEVTGFTDAGTGERGIHIHQIGRCHPDFAAAGDHFNPTDAQHGFDYPEGPHAGDLPNIEIDEEGNANYEWVNEMITLSPGPYSILDADGSALLIHANTDDSRTDPTGRSGEPIACGVITTNGPPLVETDPPPPIEGYKFQPEERLPTDERIAQLQLPPGFAIDVFAEDLGNVRMMAQAADGTVLVTRRAQGDVIALRDEDGDGRAAEMEIVASDLEYVHGILIVEDDLYLVTDTDLYRTTLSEGSQLGELETVVDDLPDAGQHPNRTIRLGQDGMFYISIGSTCNACNETNEEAATIIRMRPDGSERTIFARGLRNTIGFGFHPESDELWGMDMGTDWRGNDAPPEELNLIVEGGDYGWPYCYADQQIDRHFPLEPPGRTKAEHCPLTIAPTMVYTAHSSPIGMVYYTGEMFPEEYRNDAFFAMRGSWNRMPAVGYKVVRLRFEEGQPVDFEDFVTGFLIEDGQAHFGRIAGLLVLQDGSMLLSEDTNGVIYRITYNDEAPAEDEEPEGDQPDDEDNDEDNDEEDENEESSG
jgi:glucose/arabinose dehydrogenase/Cu/Zn superoxide dismutase